MMYANEAIERAIPNEVGIVGDSLCVFWDPEKESLGALVEFE